MGRTTVAVPPDAEGRLLVLMLVDALESLRRDRGSDDAQRAREWVCAPTGDGEFSFARACETVGLDADRLRRRLGLRAQVARRQSAAGRARRPSW